jgi:hypothetical protein
VPASSDFFAIVNYAEAALWAAMGVGFVVRAIVSPSAGWASLAAAAALFAFAVSDVVEVRTGAWWRPWWLLAWKGACLAVLVGLLRAYVRSRWRSANRGTALPATATSGPNRPA